MNTEILHETFTPLRICAASIMIILCVVGLTLNFSVFYGLMSQKQKLSGFYTLCASKTISNSAICFTFFVWAVPCTILNSYFLPLQVNIIFGQIGGWMPYIMGPFTQLCMATNRFCALFLPQYYSRSYRLPLSLCGVLTFWTISFVITAIGLRPSCGFIYVIKHLAWEPEESECATFFAVAYFYLIVATSICANFFNTIIAIKLIASAAKATVSHTVSEQRRKRRTKMYIQSVSQDCLHIMDTINCSIISHFSTAVWYRFIFSSLSFLGIHVFDGLIMILFNKQLRPPCFCARVDRSNKFVASHFQKITTISSTGN